MSFVSRFLKAEVQKEFTGEDIYNFCNEKCHILLYNQLENINLSDLLNDKPSIAILYESYLKNHWVCLTFNEKTSTLSYFDSYALGLRLEEILDTTKGKLYLSKAIASFQMRNTHVIFEQNTKRLQEYQTKNNEVSTCGRWVAFRILCRYFDNHTFTELCQPKLINTSDEIITLVTLRQNLLNDSDTKEE